MIVKTRGIVLNYIKYQESSVICKIYTEDQGLVSVIINGIRSQKSKRSLGFFQPFSLLELEIYYRSNREIHRLADYRYLETTPLLYQDMVKSSIILFLSEMLTKILSGENEPHPELFEFIAESVLAFNKLEVGVENFHLHFLLALPSYLGYGVESGQDLINQLELVTSKEHSEVIAYITLLAETPYEQPVQASGRLRFKVLELLISYYQLHSPMLGEIKSLKVLHSVFT